MVDRIKQVLEYSQMSTKAFADTIKLNPSSLTHIFNGRNQPSLDVVKKILTAFPEVNSEWLVMGMGEMLQDVPASVVAEEKEISYSTVDNMQQADLFSAFELESITPAPKQEEPEEVVEETAPVVESTVVEPVVKQVVKTVQPVVEIPETAPVVTPAPRVVATPPVEPVVETPPAPARRGRSSESHNSTRESKRDRISNSQGDKKLVKIVMFYDDRSFEEYFPS